MLISAIFLIVTTHVFTTHAICCSKDKTSSRMTPRFFACRTNRIQTFLSISSNYLGQMGDLSPISSFYWHSDLERIRSSTLLFFRYTFRWHQTQWPVVQVQMFSTTVDRQQIQKARTETVSSRGKEIECKFWIVVDLTQSFGLLQKAVTQVGIIYFDTLCSFY